MSWDVRFIGLAHTVATWSKDSSVKVGCVLVNPLNNAVVSLGFNGFPRNVDDDGTHAPHPEGMVVSRWVRPFKYQYVEHAERNAIYNAACQGHATNGCTAYLNYCPSGVCADCARALIQAGIRRLVGPNIVFPGLGKQWQEHQQAVAAMLFEANVQVVTLNE